LRIATHCSIDNNSGRKSRGKNLERVQEREERSAIGLETAALIDATGKRGRKRRSSEDEWERRRAYMCEGNSGDSAVFEYAGEKRKRK